MTVYLAMSASPKNLVLYLNQKHITSKRLISPYTSGTKLGFISQPIKSADAFLPKYGIKSKRYILFENLADLVRPLEKKPSKSYKNESLSYNPCRESVV